MATRAVLFLAIFAEARGDKDVRVWGRMIPAGTIRLAISVTFRGATLVLAATALLMTVSTAPLDRILFEVISAFATCGPSTGLNAELEPFGKYVLAAVMLASRIGPSDSQPPSPSGRGRFCTRWSVRSSADGCRLQLLRTAGKLDR